MKNPFKKYSVDLFGEKKKFLDAGIKNLEQSNEMSGRFQTLIATIILAQLAFLGTLGFDHGFKILSACAISALVLALLINLIAASWQQLGIIDSAKFHFKKAKEVDNIIRKTTKEHLSLEEYQERINIGASTLGFTKLPNRLMLISYVLGVVGTVLVLSLVWNIVLLSSPGF